MGLLWLTLVRAGNTLVTLFVVDSAASPLQYRAPVSGLCLETPTGGAMPRPTRGNSSSGTTWNRGTLRAGKAGKDHQERDLLLHAGPQSTWSYALPVVGANAYFLTCIEVQYTTRRPPECHDGSQIGDGLDENPSHGVDSTSVILLRARNGCLLTSASP